MSRSGLPSWRGSVFWRVAAVLLAVQLVAVAVAVGLSARDVYDRALDLAAEGLRLRVDAVAEELELRADWDEAGLESLSQALLLDLSSRFPDPVILVDGSANPILAVRPDGSQQDDPSRLQLSGDLAAALESGAIVTSRDEGWMAAPVYDDVGFLAGGLVISPISGSLQRELAPARVALIRALSVSGVVVLLVGLLLAGLLTVGLVDPLRQMTRQVEAIGRGDYAQRVGFTGRDELGRLGETINHMAAQVATSIKELQATDRIRRELVANVGHDLRTPLAALLGRIDESDRMLSEGDLDRAVSHLENAQRQARYLKLLVDDLFELAILDTPSPPLRREPIPMAELIRDVSGQHRTDLDRREIALEISVAEGLPLVEADGVRLIRLLTNLLSNAERHTPDGGTIEILVQAGSAGVEVRVADSGPGMEEDTLENLFDRYYRGTDARTRTSEGTGLGLPISRAIAVAHGGTLKAANRPEGGAVFTLFLPTQT